MSATILLVTVVYRHHQNQHLCDYNHKIAVLSNHHVHICHHNHHYNDNYHQGPGWAGHCGQSPGHAGHSWAQEGQEVIMTVMMIILTIFLVILNMIMMILIRWSLGLIFHQCWVDCARALLLVPLGRSLLLCAPVYIIVIVIVIVKISSLCPVIVIMLKHHGDIKNVIFIVRIMI